MYTHVSAHLYGMCAQFKASALASIYIHKCIGIQTQANIHVYTHTQTHRGVAVRNYKRVRLYRSIFIDVLVYTHARIRIYIHTHKHMYTCLCAHLYGMCAKLQASVLVSIGRTSCLPAVVCELCVHTYNINIYVYRYIHSCV